MGRYAMSAPSLEDMEQSIREPEPEADPDAEREAALDADGNYPWENDQQ